MIAPAKTWQIRFAQIPKTSSPAWAKPIADEVDALVTSKAQLADITGQVNFIFNKAIFAVQLQQLTLSKTKDAPAAKQAAAWAAAVRASTITVLPGAFFQAPLPPKTFSIVASSMIDPDSITLAEQTLKAEILQCGFVEDPNDSKLPLAFRNAFLALTVTIIGTDSQPPPPPNPLPLTIPKIPLI